MKDPVRRVGLASVSVAASMFALASGAAGAGAPTASPKDTFKASITAASGKFSGDHGNLTVYVVAPQPTTATRGLTLVLVGKRCGTARRCLDLSGRPTGTLTPQRSLPDVGRSFRVGAAGNVKPLGHVSITGTAHGVGFVSKGHEQLKLTLTTPSGKVTLVGSSAPVPGFSSP